MASVFTRSNERNADVKRNVFDLSFQNNLTMKMGALYPVFCKEVVPGDSFSIKPTFALEMLPMVFPVQTRMRANLHFFYVRNRNLWKDFIDFYGDTKPDLDPPYLDFSGDRFDKYAKTGSLGDYFGLPTTKVGNYGSLAALQPFGLVGSMPYTPFQSYATETGGIYRYLSPADLYSLLGNMDDFINIYETAAKDVLPSTVQTQFVLYEAACDHTFTFDAFGSNDLLFNFKLHNGHNPTAYPDVFNSNYVSKNVFVVRIVQGSQHYSAVVCFGRSTQSDKRVLSSLISVSQDGLDAICSISLSNSLLDDLVNLYSFDATKPFSMSLVSVLPANDKSYTYDSVQSFNEFNLTGVKYNFFSDVYVPVYDILGSVAYIDSVANDVTRLESPYFDSTSAFKSSQLKISALPYRAYESCYNAFYRDIRNNPFMIDGKPEYNKYIPSQDGGIDSNVYDIRFRNWEQDFLTTAVQSPQQGVAPLVGISSLGELTFKDAENKTYNAQAEFAEDGETITGFKVLSSDFPNGTYRSLVDMASSGISINDLRNVNSLQRWLETNMRKGMRYKNLVEGHFGVNIRYDELDMPEFIGGTSEDIRVNMVTQTSSDVDGSPLGSYAGQGSCVGTSGHNISHFCDEHGYIIGIFSVAPVPNYSQLLPKHFLKRNTLDYFTPEFGHIGFVPIKYNEVCPVQAYNDSPSVLKETFGYQRAWYDYLASVDEVHGLFRTSLRNYLVNRTFNIRPELSESFLLVDPKQINDIFASTTDTDDKILGQIYFDVRAKRPIPMYGIPRLE